MLLSISRNNCPIEVVLLLLSGSLLILCSIQFSLSKDEPNIRYYKMQVCYQNLNLVVPSDKIILLEARSWIVIASASLNFFLQNLVGLNPD